MGRECLIDCMVTQEWTSHMHIHMQGIRGGDDKKQFLRQEVDLLRRVLRRNRDQHVASLFYKKLEHVFRLLLRVCDFLEESVFVYVALRKASLPVTSLHERQVPCIESGIKRLECIFDQCQLLVSVIHACYMSAKQCCIQLAQSFFMPLSVACLALSARIQTLSVSLLQQKCNEYNSFVSVVRYLPSKEGHSTGCGVDTEHLPDHVVCSVKKGHVPGIRRISVLENQRHRDLLGLYVVQSEGQTATDLRDGCLVMEDHGLPVPREDMMHVICDMEKQVEDTLVGDIAPAFEIAEESVMGLSSKEDSVLKVEGVSQKNEPGVLTTTEDPVAKASQEIVVREAVPSLGKRKTEFIRIGHGKTQDSPPLKSWEEWVCLPSDSDSRKLADESKNEKKNKKRRRKM